ncbi:MAG: CehA/McbA family metallohydrolase, partial [Candidatus Hydrogenedentes bacterium]|nr:CehA/McbA family metallohydrolase [Candidatus Hydrogenedentota bacterium]
MKRWCIFTALITVLAGPVFALPESVQDGPAPFASALLQRGAPLLNDAQRGQLDALNRALREAENQQRQAQDDAAKAAAAAKLEALGPGLAAFAAQLKSAPVAWQAAGGVLPAVAPLELEGERTALLFKIEAGDGPVRFSTIRFDFSQHSSYRLLASITPPGTTWLLLTLDNVPHLTTHWELEVKAGENPAVILPFDLTTPDAGTLNVTVLSDDTGHPTPAMVRLVWAKDGQDFRPANAVDFAPQFDHQGNFTGPRRTNYPGRWAGGYWCVPGPFEMEVPAGEWEVTVLRGVEHVPVTDQFSVGPNETVARTYRPERWVDMRRKGWYSGDDHVHGQILSDSDAANLMAWIQAEDVHLANVVKMGDIYRTWFDQRGFGEDFRVVDKDYILSPGQECPRTHDQLGHTLQMNIKNMIRDTGQYYLYDTVFDQVEAQGGLSGYAHVNSVLFHVHRDMSMNIPKGKVDFIELLQFTILGTDLYYDFLNLGFKVTASSGSDVPWGGSVGEVRAYAYTGRHRFTADRWFEAVREGHTFVTNGIMLDLRVNRARPGDEVVVDDERPVHVRARAFGDTRRLEPKKLEIVSQGEVIREITSSGPYQEELELEFELSSGNGCWIAARAEGSDGSRAHTTPIYVVRPPFRFWKF